MTAEERAIYERAFGKKVLGKALEQSKADGCSGCAFITTEEWEMPCCKCMRSCKDYWRRAGEQE